ncbi:HlyD family efflux transporter periplasmic adaptor subunit [Limnoglobus roseus]|uniref:WD40 repeat domain-containing protein n=1 Tax=Limnoglobus roseus TaxID=2598579 RepID=A0A5C1AFI9_9BACT|nr:HlyD family efflux transporter periplasmic adaptor subunit [Limnoglobus roseus]QEL18189.1 WD40 repeat domain-containing protein [Limnoglobus roseus]
MNRRWILKTATGLSCLALSACDGDRNVKNPSNATGTSEKTPAVEIGSLLYKPGDPPEPVAPATAATAEIIVPNSVVRLDKKQLISALVDGNIEVIGVPLAPGTAFKPDDGTLMFESADMAHAVPYKRLREGDRIAGNSVVCVLDDLDARVQSEASRKVSEACVIAIGEAKKAADKILEQVSTMKKLGGAASPLELIQLEATYARYLENVAQSQKEKVKAEGDEKRADALRFRHRSRSKDGGIITKLMREPGEFVKAGDPIMEVLSTEDVRVEGILESQNAALVRPGMKVSVEPSVPVGPDMKFGQMFPHRQSVTAVVVTAHAGRPMIVSGSLDNTVSIWDAFPPAGTQPKSSLLSLPPEAQGVRSLAVTGEKVTKHVLATGGEDGKVRLWDLSNLEKISNKPMKELDEAHGTSVASMSFSPDGRFLATAAGREVFIWNVADGKKLYTLAGDFKDGFTSVRFTPQSTLVTVSRDRAMRVWKVGDKAASIERTIDHRKGNVDVLGVSSKGGRALFDQDDGRIDVISLATGLSIGNVQNNGPAARFGTLALFSPDDALVLTAGGDGDIKGELQLWTTPMPGGRGSERTRLVVPGHMTPTCAAFGPEGANWFVVTGTQSGSVHVWTASVLSQKNKERTGQVTAVIPNDARTFRVTVVIDRGTDAGTVLQDKSSATIIVKPSEVAAPPVAGNATAIVPMEPKVPMSVVVPAGGVLPASAVVPASGTGVERFPPVVVPAIPMHEGKPK